MLLYNSVILETFLNFKTIKIGNLMEFNIVQIGFMTDPKKDQFGNVMDLKIVSIGDLMDPKMIIKSIKNKPICSYCF